MVRPLGFEPKTARLEGECSIQLSYERITKNNFLNIKYCGTPERTRTPNPQIRSLMLYPIEPLAHSKWGGRRGSNPRPPVPQTGALPTELRPP